MEKDDIMQPIQPYIIRDVSDYYSIDCPYYGTSQFYEFELQGSESNMTKAVPDSSIDLLFALGDDKVTTYISGTVFSVKNWQLGEQKKYFGVRFQPGKASLPKELSMDMLVNTDLEIDGNLFGENICEQLALAKDINERIHIFQIAYQNMIQNAGMLSDKERINDYLVSRITRAKGMVSMSQLEEETRYSACYLRRIFKSIHGISPKQFAEHIRFQHLLKQIGGMVRYDEIALECGYYDEAHMMKEFKKFTGITMEQYQNMTKGKV